MSRMIIFTLSIVFLFSHFSIAQRGPAKGKWEEFWNKAKKTYEKDATKALGKKTKKPGGRLRLASKLEKVDEEFTDIEKIVSFASSATDNFLRAKKRIQDPSVGMDEKVGILAGIQGLEEEWTEKVNLIELTEFLKASATALETCDDYIIVLEREIDAADAWMDTVSEKQEKKKHKRHMKALKKLRAAVFAIVSSLEYRVKSMRDSKAALSVKRPWITTMRDPSSILKSFDPAISKGYIFVRTLEAMEPDALADGADIGDLDDDELTELLEELNAKIKYFNDNNQGYTRDLSQVAMNVKKIIEGGDHMFDLTLGEPADYFVSAGPGKGDPQEWLAGNKGNIDLVDIESIESIDDAQQKRFAAEVAWVARTKKVLTYTATFKSLVKKLEAWYEDQ